MPLFDTVAEAREATGADATSIYVPPPFAADAILEAIDAGIPFIVAITEGIPVLDMVKVKRALEGSGSRLLGPQLPRRADAERVQDRHHAGQHLQGRARRHRLALGHADLRGGEADVRRRARAVDRRRHRRRSGQGTGVHRGARPVPGRPQDRFHHHDRRDRRLRRRRSGRVHQARSDARAAPSRWPASSPASTAPPGRRMGHAGAIISGGKGKAEDKQEAMRSAGIAIAASPAALGTTLMGVLKGGDKKPQTKHAKVAK